MRTYSTRFTSAGIALGGLVGLLAGVAGVMLPTSRRWPSEESYFFRLAIVAAALGFILGALLGGLSGAAIDSVLDRRRRKGLERRRW